MLLAAAEITATDPTLLYAIYGVIAGLVGVVAAIIVVLLKINKWVSDGIIEALKSEDGRQIINKVATDALKSDDGRKIVVETVMESAKINEKIQKEADTQSERAIQPLLAKFDSLVSEVKGMRQELHAVTTKVSDATEKFIESQHALDTRLQILEREISKKD